MDCPLSQTIDSKALDCISESDTQQTYRSLKMNQTPSNRGSKRIAAFLKLVLWTFAFYAPSALCLPIFSITPRQAVGTIDAIIIEGQSFDLDFKVTNLSMAEITMRNVFEISPTFIGGDIDDEVFNTEIIADFCAGKTLRQNDMCRFTQRVFTRDLSAVNDHNYGDWIVASHVRYIDATGVINAEVASAGVRVIDIPLPPTIYLVIAAVFAAFVGRRNAAQISGIN